MGVVSNLLDFREGWEAPTLVLVDLHDDPLPGTFGLGRKDFSEALENCSMALDYARQNSFPVAFVRHVSPPHSFLAPPACPSWIRDIRPHRSDMIFERAMPSCFASTEFAQMAQRSRGLILAGLFGETSCLATLVEGYGRHHHFTYLGDASVSRGRDGVRADDVHRSVIGIASFYCEISSTHAWIDRMSRKVSTVQ